MSAAISIAQLAAVRDLSLVARTLVDGTMFGAHPGKQLSAGLEFSQYRAYQPGDDPRRVDWKLVARADRYFVRESETETSITIRIVLDASRSMAHEEDGVSKWAYARMLAAALLTVAARQGDAGGLLLATERPTVIAPSRESRHLQRVLHLLEHATPAGGFPPWRTLEPHLVGARGITIILSDLHEHADELRGVARKLAALGHDLLVLRILGARERTLDWSGPTLFEDLETGQRVELDPAAARTAYTASLQAETRALRDAIEGPTSWFGVVGTDEPPADALRRLLRARARGASAL